LTKWSHSIAWQKCLPMFVNAKLKLISKIKNFKISLLRIGPMLINRQYQQMILLHFKKENFVCWSKIIGTGININLTLKKCLWKSRMNDNLAITYLKNRIFSYLQEITEHSLKLFSKYSFWAFIQSKCDINIKMKNRWSEIEKKKKNIQNCIDLNFTLLFRFCFVLAKIQVWTFFHQCWLSVLSLTKYTLRLKKHI